MRAPTLLLIAILGVSCAHECAASPLTAALSLFGLGKKDPAKQQKKEVIDDTKRTLQERLSQPNLEKSFDATKGSPVANRPLGTRKASTKEFSTRAFSAREFAARDYAGAKGAHLAKDRYATDAAPTTGRNVIPNIDSKAPTKAVPVSSARDADKTVATRTMATRSRQELLDSGRSQARLDLEKGEPRYNKPLGFNGELKKLTIDDVRELLNKNE